MQLAGGMRAALQRTRAEQSGMTLIELMIGMSIALVVTFASFAVLERATSASHEIADRQDAIQRGRLAMETMTRQLRSQVCLGETAEPISYGDGSTVTFYADLSDGSRNVTRRRLTYLAPTATAPGKILEELFEGSGTYPDLEFGATPTTTRVLLSGADQVRSGDDVAEPVFRYYAFQPGSPTGDLQELATPLTAEDASRTIMVHIEFVALPERPRPRNEDATTLEDSVYVRIADPTRPLEGPRCL